MGLTMPDALVILGVFATVITAFIKYAKPGKSPTCATCAEHTGIVKTIEALNVTLTRLQNTMDKMSEYFIRERGKENGR